MVLTILKVRVGNMEGGVRPWLDEQFENQDRWVLQRLDTFESRINR